MTGSCASSPSPACVPGRIVLSSEDSRIPAHRETQPMSGPQAKAEEQTRLSFDSIVETTDSAHFEVETKADGPAGALPLTDEMLRHWPSGDLFGLSQNAGMGWDAGGGRPRPVPDPEHPGRPARRRTARPIALGYHTGHWEVGLLVQEAAEELKRLGVAPFAAMVSDPCDGRTQGTAGMMDSLPYRNDAAIVFRRLIRSLPRRKGVLGVATCDKGLPAMMLALAGVGHLPGVIVPGGVTLPPREGEDAGKIQSIGARYSHGELTPRRGRRARLPGLRQPRRRLPVPRHGRDVAGRRRGARLAVPHAALAPSGQPIWRDMARRSARALVGAGATAG